MDELNSSDNQYSEVWNGPAGRAWVQTQDLLDRIMKPIGDSLIEALAPAPECRLLDVGCGTGSTTVAAARKLGMKDSCVGIDISEPMLAAARKRAEDEGATIKFLCANAETYPFESQQFDAIISRFGVMFFANPVQAFSNLRKAARNQAELRLIVWRSAEDNPFMTEAERAAAPILSLQVRKANAPGQFAFGNARNVDRILQQSGWKDTEILPLDIACSLPESELDRYLTHLGPVGTALQSEDQQTRDRVLQAVRPAFARYIHGNEVQFNAACWMVHARAAS